MRAFLTILLACMLVGCGGDDLTAPLEPEATRFPAPDGRIRVNVNVVDEAGRPFRPDQVWWYYPPDEHGRADEYDARCVNLACTRWGVTGAADGRVYVAALATRKYNDRYCNFVRYDAMPVQITSRSVPEVTLHLEEAEMCE